MNQYWHDSSLWHCMNNLPAAWSAAINCYSLFINLQVVNALLICIPMYINFPGFQEALNKLFSYICLDISYKQGRLMDLWALLIINKQRMNHLPLLYYSHMTYFSIILFSKSIWSGCKGFSASNDPSHGGHCQSIKEKI